MAATNATKKVQAVKRGRPVTRTMPQPIPDTPANVLRALLTTPPKKRLEWEYLKRKH